MTYDQGSWHTDECSEKGCNEAFAGTHIALYVKWCHRKGLLADDLKNEDSEVLDKVLSNEMTANEYFENYLDWKFGDWNLSPEGKEFADMYYESYIADLEERFPEIIYADESNVDWTSYCDFLDEQYDNFCKQQSESIPAKKVKPWWKIW